MIQAYCKSCKLWSSRIGHVTDQCEHCGALFDQDVLSVKSEKEKIRKQSENESILFVREEDSAQKKKLKQVAIKIRFIVIAVLFVIMMVVFLSHG